MCVAQNKMRDGESARESCETANSCFDDCIGRRGLFRGGGQSDTGVGAAFPDTQPITDARPLTDAESGQFVSKLQH